MASGSSSSTTLPTRQDSGINLTTLTHFKLHVVIFPYMAQGHTIPLLDLAKCLTRRQVRVTIITTPANVGFISSYTSGFPAISTVVIPFPEVSNLPKGCENTSALPSADYILSFIIATELLQDSFDEVLERMMESHNPPVCVISDYYLNWTLDSCNLYGIPRIVFHGMGVLPILINKDIDLRVMERHAKAELPFSPDEILDSTVAEVRVPFELHEGDFPEALWSADGPDDNEFLGNVLQSDLSDVFSWGVIVNSFEELERPYIPAFETFRRRTWCVGPLLLGNNTNDERSSNDPCIKWLEKRSVDHDSAGAIYVSFGSQATLDDDQMNEIAYGLQMAGESFIWLVKSDNWNPPPGWEDSIGSLGFITREWVNQRKILQHPGVGGFLSHCSWNSVLEGLTAGVPLLAWPMGAEQPINAKYIVEQLHMGIKMPRENGDTNIVDRSTIFAAVKELMRGDQGKNARKKAREYGELAKEAMTDGGPSHMKLNQLVERLLILKLTGNFDA